MLSNTSVLITEDVKDLMEQVEGVIQSCEALPEPEARMAIAALSRRSEVHQDRSQEEVEQSEKMFEAAQQRLWEAVRQYQQDLEAVEAERNKSPYVRAAEAVASIMVEGDVEYQRAFYEGTSAAVNTILGLDPDWDDTPLSAAEPVVQEEAEPEDQDARWLKIMERGRKASGQ